MSRQRRRSSRRNDERKLPSLSGRVAQRRAESLPDSGLRLDLQAALPEHLTARPLRQAQMLQLQQQRGNAYVSQLLARRKAGSQLATVGVLQRKEEKTASAKPKVMSIDEVGEEVAKLYGKKGRSDQEKIGILVNLIYTYVLSLPKEVSAAIGTAKTDPKATQLEQTMELQRSIHRGIDQAAKNGALVTPITRTIKDKVRTFYPPDKPKRMWDKNVRRTVDTLFGLYLYQLKLLKSSVPPSGAKPLDSRRRTAVSLALGEIGKVNAKEGLQEDRKKPPKMRRRVGYDRLLRYFEKALNSKDYTRAKESVTYVRGHGRPPEWCGIFAFWALKEAGFGIGNWVLGGSLYGRRDFEYKRPSSYVPKPGDILAKEKHKHMGMVVYVEENPKKKPKDLLVTTVNGNSAGDDHSAGVISLTTNKLDDWNRGIYAPKQASTAEQKKK